MKRNSMIACGCAVAICAAVFAKPVQAEEVKQRDRSQAGKLDDKTVGANVRADALIGTEIQNSQGKDVGKIEDLVIDANTGKVRYAAVTYGGFLGIGDKMFAVPFQAFQCRQDSDDADEYILVLDVTEQQLKGATGFDADHWPDFADGRFTSQLDKRYGVEGRTRARGNLGVKVDVGGVDVEVATKGDAAAGSNRAQAGKLDDKTMGANIRASQLAGMNIQNSEGKDVGNVKDIVIDANAGRVRYAAVTYGGFLGIGNQMFAVPFEAFQCRQDADDKDEYVLVLNVTKQQLEGATGFDEDHWPNFADANFTSELDVRYGVKRRMRNRNRNN